MSYIQTIFESILAFYNGIAAYLLLGLLVAGLMHLFFPDSFIKRHLGKGKILPVLKATLFGIPLPLCSCGVVPVAAALKKRGANSGATLSFMTATPQIGADSFLMTYSLLGPVFALFRIAAAFITAMISGIIVNVIEKPSEEITTASGTISKDSKSSETVVSRLKSLPRYIEFEVLGTIAATLLIGIIVAGVISASVPSWVFTDYLSNQWLSMFIMLIVGIPLYVCASASTPIAASLVIKGMAPGAALVFLLTGPATNAVTIATVIKTLGKRAAFVYIASIAFVSLLMGYLLNNYVFANRSLTPFYGNHEMNIPHWVNSTSGFILGFMLLFYFVNTYIIAPFKRKSSNMKVTTLPVCGMTCSHCAESVRKAVASIPGTSNIAVDLDGKKVSFILSNPEKKANVQEAIKEAGFDSP
jgi:uncharacterized membrane protein YraQ (UPF0718 family)/copper chaperone CopZ